MYFRWWDQFVFSGNVSSFASKNSIVRLLLLASVSAQLRLWGHINNFHSPTKLLLISTQISLLLKTVNIALTEGGGNSLQYIRQEVTLLWNWCYAHELKQKLKSDLLECVLVCAIFFPNTVFMSSVHLLSCDFWWQSDETIFKVNYFLVRSILGKGTSISQSNVDFQRNTGQRTQANSDK